MAVSALNNIPGIGTKTIELLYNKYTSLSNIKNISTDELVEAIGKKRTEILRNYLNSTSI
jgi:excinuclease UvrABC nuclease subunit